LPTTSKILPAKLQIILKFLGNFKQIRILLDNAVGVLKPYPLFLSSPPPTDCDRSINGAKSNLPINIFINRIDGGMPELFATPHRRPEPPDFAQINQPNDINLVRFAYKALA
jgi:hypothetical protein